MLEEVCVCVSAGGLLEIFQECVYARAACLNIKSHLQ